MGRLPEDWATNCKLQIEKCKLLYKEIYYNIISIAVSLLGDFAKPMQIKKNATKTQKHEIPLIIPSTREWDLVFW